MSSSAALPALRFMTCGSVDDGKSTLIGRLLFEQGVIPADQLATLFQQGAEDVDYALVLDGLEGERQQGITIDVAYRYFATARRSFVVADAPGHEQYTRNMVTAASNADFAILLADARKGLLPQTRRHAAILSLLGVRHVALAVNKMDLVGYERAAFDAVRGAFAAFAAQLDLASVAAIPVSALVGDNISSRSAATPWHDGPSLIELLETIDVGRPVADGLRLPIQWVDRREQDRRRYLGSIASGRFAIGDKLVSAVSGEQVEVSRMFVSGEDAAFAEAGDAVAVELAGPVDLARGDMLCAPDDRPEVGNQFAAHVIWMDEQPLLVGRSYLLKLGPVCVPAVVSELRHQLNVSTLEKLAAKSLERNEIGFCNLTTAGVIPFDAYARSAATGGFILIDRISNATAAAGVIGYQLRRSRNIRRQPLAVSRQQRAALKGHPPKVLWFTGLSGAGKSTIANLVEAQLHARGAHTMMLDGDNLRLGLNRDLGFTAEARIENIRRVGEVAKLMTDAGLIVLCCFISPFAADRRLVRDMLGDAEFVEIHVHVPIEVAIGRDPKGLYKQALEGRIKNFTGVDQAYEEPERPDLRLDTTHFDAHELANIVLDFIGW
jgi:bifunctional enzyme CysN/CysC